jgi:hypothetical protein
VADGQFLARSRATGERITTTPLVVGVNLLVQADDGTLAAFALVEDEDEDDEEEDEVDDEA